jgi:3-methyladenine DNA glycosylase AlkD
MKAADFVAAVEHALAPLGDPARAQAMSAYMRDQFSFLGVPTPARRQATAALIRTRMPANALLANARALWQQPEREYQYVAVDLLARQWQTLTLADVPALLQLAQQRSWWDSVDGLAGVMGDIVKAACSHDHRAQGVMDEALLHPNLWMRRIAMLHQLGWRAATNERRLFDYATTLAHEPDFFIRKAIGWALRDYARHAPERVRAFLVAQQDRLSALTLREAGKHL